MGMLGMEEDKSFEFGGSLNQIRSERKETGRMIEADQRGEKEWKSNRRLFGRI